ncbi:hypothetical protein ACIB24_07280 [Spongisporangium articulatum]|uniref:Peptidase M50 domain-containing protein n=1 Tax=Spongisporangium articulatum TaxID=3362603 RepID=A0ABW8AKH4_9ACTN
MSRRALLWVAGMLAVAVGVNVVDVPGAFPARVDELLVELARGPRWVELLFRAGLVVELLALLAVATALMISVHEAGHALAARGARGRASVVLLGGSAANLLCAALAALALALGGFTALAGHLASVFPDPLFALLVAGVWVGANNLLPVADDGHPRDGLQLRHLPPAEPAPAAEAGAASMQPAMVRAELAQALAVGDATRARAAAEALLGLVARLPLTAEDAAHQLSLSVPLLQQYSGAPDCPPELAGRIAVRLGFLELRSVLHPGPEPVPGLPRAEGAGAATDDERLDDVARLMQLGARLAPGDLDARLGLAWTRSAQRRDDEAQKLARAVRLKLDAEPRVPGDYRADLADVLRAVSAARLGAAEQAERLLARVARNHSRNQNGGRLPQELAAALDYAQRVPAAAV